MSRIHERLSKDLPINSMVAPAVVDDPYSEIGEKIAVLRSIRNDPLAGLKARGFIEEYEYQAGRKWQYHLECAQIGGVRAIDPSKEAVDGGRAPEPITDKQIEAFRILADAEKRLGQEGGALIRDILADGRTIRQAADRRGASTKREELYIGRRFRECLNTIAELWGLKTRA